MSTATVAVIYGIGAELFSRRAGLYAAALAVANYYLVYYGQEARSYAFLYFLSSLSFWFFVRALKHEGWLNVGLYTVATLLLLYTHYFGFLLVLAQGVGVLLCLLINGWQQRGLLLRAGVAAAAIVLCVLPLVPVITGHAAISEFWIPTARARVCRRLLRHLLRQSNPRSCNGRAAVRRHPDSCVWQPRRRPQLAGYRRAHAV